MAATLGTKFWNKLSRISESLGMNPEDLLTVMFYESGLDPAARNKKSNASGLIQFMPDILKGLGFHGSHDDFRQLDAADQLDYVEKYIRNQMNYGGRPFKSATQYYVANIWPVALRSQGVINQDPHTPIIELNPKSQKYSNVSLEQERAAYQQNSGLDINKDGVISYGDLESVMHNVKNSPEYRYALNQMSEGKEYIAGNNVSKNPPNSPENKINKINDVLDKFLSAVALQEAQDKFRKKSEYKKYLPLNCMTIKISSNDLIDSLEFARILSLALDEEILAETSLHLKDKNLEINCLVNGPEQLCINAVTQLTESLSKVFEHATKKIGGIKITSLVIANTKSDYQNLDIKLAQTAYRHFRYKFINGQQHDY